MRKVRSKSGVFGVEDRESDDVGAEHAQCLGDLGLCADEEVWEFGAWGTSANLS